MKKPGIGTMTMYDKRCPVVDTWWQTETGGIPFLCDPTKPTYATLPLPGIQPVLMDEKEMK
jgi:acetyl-CoA synthetase